MRRPRDAGGGCDASRRERTVAETDIILRTTA